MKRLGLALKLIHRDEVHLLSTYCSRVHVILSLSLSFSSTVYRQPGFHSQQGLGFLLSIAR